MILNRKVKQISQIVIASTIVIFSLLFSAEHLLLPYLEKQYIMCASGWRKENLRLNNLNEIRNLACETKPLWSSRLFDISQNQPQKDMKVILTVGDSLIWGDGYQNVNDTWWRLLDRALHSMGLRNHKVLGLGLRGWSITDEAKAIHNYLRSESPELIVWGISGNDFATTNSALKGLFIAPSWLSQPQIECAFAQYFPNIWVILDIARSELSTKIMSGQKRGYPYYEWEKRLLENDELRLNAVKTVRLINEECKKRKVRLLVALLPFRPDSSSTRSLYSKAQEIFEQEHISVCMLGGPLEERWQKLKPIDWSQELLEIRPRKAFSITPANAHPSAQICEIWADTIARRIKHDEEDWFITSDAERGKDERTRLLNDSLPAMKIISYDNKKITFKFPDQTEMLYMPIRQPHILFGLKLPSRLSHIRLSSQNLSSAACFIEPVSPGRLASDGALIELGKQKGKDIEWTLPQTTDYQINSLRIVPECISPATTGNFFTIHLD